MGCSTAGLGPSVSDTGRTTHLRLPGNLANTLWCTFNEALLNRADAGQEVGSHTRSPPVCGEPDYYRFW
jgi:hypothetical protein